MLIAITRQVSPNIVSCELTHLPREPIDFELARVQHSNYEDALAAIDCKVLSLPHELDLPDSVFVEDIALVFDELAVITRPGADSRRPEIHAIATALRPFRSLACIEAPGNLDGGDVLRVEEKIFVGLSSRSNQAAVDQLRSALQPFGYTVEGVPVDGCLHLKSAATLVAKNTLLINRAWVDVGPFMQFKLIDVDPAEPRGGNALLVGQTLIYPAAYPATRKRLSAHGIQVKTVNLSELCKAEGGVTCCSLIFAA